MKSCRYVLVTPVRDEEATIQTTIESVISQTILPKRWVIVSDQSSDQTDEIIKGYALKHPFIRLLQLRDRPKRNFASVVFATEAGIGALGTVDYDFLGLLDGDLRFSKNYFEEILIRFSTDSMLGLAGGLVVDVNQRDQKAISIQEVAGAVQLFRRECFESLDGFIALPEGGWDAITCVQARMHGFKTRTFAEIKVDHLKPRNISQGNLCKRFYQLGTRDYALGYHPVFEVVKCCYRSLQPPMLIGGFMWLAGYIGCHLRRKKRLLPPDLVRYIREEQLKRLLPIRKTVAVLTQPAVALKNDRQPVAKG